jgi:outer membrane protein assembly factor BamA
MANAELRFPLIRRFDLGLLPISLPPLDGLVFYDAGLAWNPGQTVALSRTAAQTNTRVPLTSYGFGLRLNAFGFAIIRWDYAIPLDQPNRKGFWAWSIGPSF